MTRRVQLRRTKGYRKPAATTAVARPTKWGNPWRAGECEHYSAPGGGAELAAAFFGGAMVDRLHDEVQGQDPYEHEVDGFYPTLEAIRAELAGRDLACWCSPDALCHADVLLIVANQPASTAVTACSDLLTRRHVR